MDVNIDLGTPIRESNFAKTSRDTALPVSFATRPDRLEKAATSIAICESIQHRRSFNLSLIVLHSPTECLADIQEVSIGPHRHCHFTYSV